MTAEDIKKILKGSLSNNWSGVFVPEFTYQDKRADAIIIDVKKRWVRCFEIKVSRSDFLQDNKWTEYSQFCSSLTMVCPEGLIQPEEIEKPFGLLWVLEKPQVTKDLKMINLIWKKNPKNLQIRNSLAWLWTYVNIIELELIRGQYQS
jgi:hypothetical protein